MICKYDTLFRFPQTTLQSFQEHTGWSSDTKADPNPLDVEPGLSSPPSNGFNGSLVFTFEGGFEVEVPNEELVHPLWGINTSGARVLDTNITEINIFHQEVLETASMGKAFLSQVSETMFDT
jgi:hypothetical protein